MILTADIKGHQIKINIIPAKGAFINVLAKGRRKITNLRELTQKALSKILKGVVALLRRLHKEGVEVERVFLGSLTAAV
jgi:hypothetical protein